MKGLMSKLKNKKVIGVGLIIILLIVIVVISFVLSNKNSETTTKAIDKDIETSAITLNYNVNEDCINYLEDLEVFRYEDVVNSDYSDTLYYTHSDEVYEYYLVCLTDLSVTIDEEETDLNEAIESELITLDELDSLLVQEEIDEYMVTPTIEEVATDKEDTDEESDLEEETDSEEASTTSNSSSNNSSSSSNNSSSSSSSSSNKSSASSSNSSSNSSSSNSSSSSSSSSNSSSSSSSSGSSSSGSSSSSSSSSSKSCSETDFFDVYYTTSQSDATSCLNSKLSAKGYQWDFNSMSEVNSWMQYWGGELGWSTGYGYIAASNYSSWTLKAFYTYIYINPELCPSVVTSNISVDWHTLKSNPISPHQWLINHGYISSISDC